MRAPRTSLPDLSDLVDDEAATALAESPLRLVDHESGPPLPTGAEGLRPMIEQLLTELKSQRRVNGRLIVKTGGKVLFLRALDVEWVEAAGNYVRLHVGSESYLYRESMKNMESRLDGDQFVRIHRSAIVNLDRIRELQPWFHGEYVVILQDGTKLMASRVFSDRLGRLIA
jgi:two-component system LytT family response regulator